jgi:two-component system invasion response regulator UvrY
MKAIRVALVDDHELIRKSLAKLLESSKVSVEFDAGDGIELQRFIAKKQVDVVLMDISMPRMDGIETTEWLKSNYPEVKVIALSVMDDESNIIRMLKAGARAYLLKNSKPDDLVRAITDVQEKGYHYSEIVSGALLNKINHGNHVVPGPESLTEKEFEFLRLCCTELTYKEIGIIMKVSPRTAEGYAKQLCEKLNLKSRVGLVLYALKHHLATA